MTRFLRLASNINVAPLALDLHQASHLWDQNSTRRTFEGTPHAAMTDIWVRFRPAEELHSIADHRTEHRNVYWPAWRSLPSLRPLVGMLKAMTDCVELGSILITRLPPGGTILPHTDQGAWAPEFYNCKVHLTVSGQSLSTCDGETVRMLPGEAWTFDNLLVHSVENPGDVDRVVVIVSMRVEV